MDKQEKTTLLCFLKANYSTREIDKTLIKQEIEIWQ
jgi:hypothetical protein